MKIRQFFFTKINNEWLEKNWWSLPFLSAFLLMLSFYPFDLWYLGFFALVPAFYFLNFSQRITGSKIFWGGFIVGLFFSFFLSFFTLIQFHWLPETYLFVWLVRLLTIPASIISGIIVGLMFLLYVKIRNGKLTDIFVLASLSVLIEIIQSTVFSGFNNGLIAYTAHKIIPLVKLSSVFGIFGVSFVITLINSFVAFFILRAGSRKKIILLFIIYSTTLVSIYYLNNFYLKTPDEAYLSTKFALIQNSDRKNIFGLIKNNEFYPPQQMENLIIKAVDKRVDFLIYPFNPVNGYFADDSEKIHNVNIKKSIVGDIKVFDNWIKKYTQNDLIFINWLNIFSEEKLYPEIIFWNKNGQIDRYQKRKIFPFLDYTPKIFKDIELFTTSIDASSPSLIKSPIKINSVRFSPLICSEIFEQNLSRRDSLDSNIILSIGSESMFSDEIPGEWTLILSQFRAAANNRPLVRSNILGASALITEQGEIIKRLNFGQTGVLIGNIRYQEKPKNTLYGLFGERLFITVNLLFLSLIIFLKFKKRLYFKRE